MKRLVSLLIAGLFAIISAVSAGAAESSFILTESTLAELGSDILEYKPEQKIFHFKGYGSVSTEIPVSGGIYLYVTAGGYRSDSNGVTDNGVNHVCDISVECFDNDGNEVMFPGVSHAIAMCPADGVFYRCSVGSQDMYAGLPDNVSKVRLTVTGMNDTAYIKSICIVSDDTKARSMAEAGWQQNTVGNINAQTRPIDYYIMVGIVFLIALMMLGFKKWRDRIRKGK